MRRQPSAIILAVLPLGFAAGIAAAAEFSDDFTGAALRVDYDHAGTADEEHFALERIRVEGAWPGSRTQLLDPTNLGQYFVEVVDLATNRQLYTRGFAGIFGEWETTDEARQGVWRSIAEAVRVPEPRRPFQLRLRKRQDDGSFGEVWRLTIDPASRFIDRPPQPTGRVLTLHEGGDPARKVDLLILGDGYTEAQMEKFRADARAAADALFAAEPFASRRLDFNVRAVETPAAHAGISRPRAGVFRDSPLGARYNTFDAERYVLTLDDRRWRDAAAVAPYDFVLILVNERQYGGGGIFGLYSTAAAGSAFAPYLVVHEFGHHFAGLGDEYFTSPAVYAEAGAERREPWAPNVTALLDPAKLKWRDLVASGTPLPTPWDKATYEARSRELQEQRAELRAQGAPEERLEQLFSAERDLMTELLGSQEHVGAVGAFEGAMYESQGYYRPAVDCIMFTRDDVGFCPVCRRAVETTINLYSH